MFAVAIASRLLGLEVNDWKCVRHYLRRFFRCYFVSVLRVVGGLEVSHIEFPFDNNVRLLPFCLPFQFRVSILLQSPGLWMFCGDATVKQLYHMHVLLR